MAASTASSPSVHVGFPLRQTFVPIRTRCWPKALVLLPVVRRQVTPERQKLLAQPRTRSTESPTEPARPARGVLLPRRSRIFLERSRWRWRARHVVREVLGPGRRRGWPALQIHRLFIGIQRLPERQKRVHVPAVALAPPGPPRFDSRNSVPGWFGSVVQIERHRARGVCPMKIRYGAWIALMRAMSGDREGVPNNLPRMLDSESPC